MKFSLFILLTWHKFDNLVTGGGHKYSQSHNWMIWCCHTILNIAHYDMTRDRFVMISLVSPQWYWRQPRGGFSRESHLICVTRILHFLQWSVSLIVCLGAIYGHTRLSSLVPVVTAEKVAEEELETGNIIQTFSRGLKLIRGKQTCQLRHQGRCAGQRCSHISGG